MSRRPPERFGLLSDKRGTGDRDVQKFDLQSKLDEAIPRVSDEQIAKARLTVAESALRGEWAEEEVADVLSMLGIGPEILVAHEEVDDG